MSRSSKHAALLERLALARRQFKVADTIVRRALIALAAENPAAFVVICVKRRPKAVVLPVGRRRATRFGPITDALIIHWEGDRVRITNEPVGPMMAVDLGKKVSWHLGYIIACYGASDRRKAAEFAREHIARNRRKRGIARRRR